MYKLPGGKFWKMLFKDYSGCAISDYFNSVYKIRNRGLIGDALIKDGIFFFPKYSILLSILIMDK